MPKCAACDSEKATVTSGRGDSYYIDCPRCGKYNISGTAAINLQRDEWRTRISCWLRHAYIANTLPPMFMDSHISLIKETWRERTVPEKQDALLLALAQMSRYPGDGVVVADEFDHVLAWCELEDEFQFHLQTAQDRHLIEFPTTEPLCYLRPDGWDRVAELSKIDPAKSDLVFVAMAFDESLASAWSDGYRRGIEAAGYRPERVDTAPHADKIDDRIMAMIRASRLVVVDVTLQNRGAYFEAGFALGLGRPVIWGVRADDLKNLHFDTRQFAHVVWKDAADVELQIRDKIVAMFGKGSYRPSRDQRG